MYENIKLVKNSLFCAVTDLSVIYQAGRLSLKKNNTMASSSEVTREVSRPDSHSDVCCSDKRRDGETRDGGRKGGEEKITPMVVTMSTR